MAKTKNKYLKYLKPFKNIFVLILIVFCVWMLFFDAHNWFLHNELNKEIDKLEDEKEYYKSEIEKDKKSIQELKNDDNLENFAREEYNMKKDDEEIYIIEYENQDNKKDDE